MSDLENKGVAHDVTSQESREEFMGEAPQGKTRKGKRKWWVVLVLFLVVGSVVGVGWRLVMAKLDDLNQTSRAFVDRVVPQVCRDLRWETLDRYACEELRAEMTAHQAEIERLFAFLRKVGEFKEYKGATGEAQMHYYWANRVAFTAEYAADVEFATGPAQVRVRMIQRGGSGRSMICM